MGKSYQSNYYFIHMANPNFGLGSGPKSGFIVLAFKVMDDDNTKLFDQGWSEWSGAISLTASLSRRKYEIRKVACYKGVNICPEIFKYIVLIEFLIPEG